MADLLERLKAALSDRYRIERELGSGGMATVYLAHDLKHDRQVALKVMRPELSAILGGERFLREIRIAAKLNHPHVLALYDSGSADGFLYYVMPHVEGESLRSKIEREKQLSIDEAVSLTRQVASALDYAHQQGVIHRDIKPENILLHRGEAVVVDFGIALAVTAAGGERLTETGLSLGTPEYMSPEQATGGGKLDQRADIYSLGAVLYEMVTGEPPQTGATVQAVIAKLLSERPTQPHVVRDSVPEAVDRAIMKALSKAPVDRFESVTEFAEALVEAMPSAGADAKSIAVLPFANLSSDPDSEFFSDGITEDVITKLSKIRDLKVISRTSVMQYKGVTKPLRQIASELGVASILEGSVRQAGARVRVSAQLIDAGTDHHLWAETYDRDLTDIFAIQSEIAQNIARALEAQLAPVEKTYLELLPTSDPEAYELYLRGRHLFANTTGGYEQSLKRAVEHFERAIEHDPTYADPYAGLANILAFRALMGYEDPTKIFQQAKSAARRALELNEHLPEAQSAWGVVSFFLDWDWPAAEKARLRALELNPGSSQVLWDFTAYLIAMRRFDEAVEGARNARELDPLSPDISGNLAWAFFMSRRYEEAMDELDRLETLNSGLLLAGSLKAWTYWFMGLADEAMRAADCIAPTLTDSPTLFAMLGFIYAGGGRTDDAYEVIASLKASAETRHVDSMALSFPYIALRDHDAAFEQLTKAFEERSPAMVYLAQMADLWFAGISGDSRYKQLLEKMNLLDVAPALPASV